MKQHAADCEQRYHSCTCGYEVHLEKMADTPPPQTHTRPYPDLLSEAERIDILSDAEGLWRALEANNLGGFSGHNRPFYILHAFKQVIEKYGKRDVGLTWSKNALDEAAPSPEPNLLVDTGCKDKDGNALYLGDRIRYRLEGSHTKREYWNPEYEIIWDAPSFTLKHVGGGKDGGSHAFILKHGGFNGDLTLISRGPHHPAPQTNVARDCLPKGHVILEQADTMDGRVSQTVRAADGSEYERIVHADEAYGEDE